MCDLPQAKLQRICMLFCRFAGIVAASSIVMSCCIHVRTSALHIGLTLLINLLIANLKSTFGSESLVLGQSEMMQSR